MTLLVGIDASLTHTGVRVLREGVPHTEAWKPPKALRGAERLAWFRERFASLFADHVSGASVTHPGTAALEGYAFGARNGREAAGELGGVVRLAAHDAGMRLLVVPPTVLKKYVTGKGTGDKAVMLLKVYQRWGFETDDHNVADAYALARFAEAAAAPEEARTKAFRALLGKVA